MVDMTGSFTVTYHGPTNPGPTAGQGAGGSSSRGTDSGTVTDVGYVSANPAANLITADNLLKNANVVAFLHTISYAEGGSYNSINSGYHTNDLSKFPYSPTSSSAAGAYQIVQRTYQELSSQLNLHDFSAHTQDEMAAFLLWKSGTAQALLKGDFQGALYKASVTWAALPQGSGSLDINRYPQPYHHYQDVLNYYHNQGGS